MAEEPSSDLPAPYVSPWVLLRRDLRAALASLGLSAREALRLNREGRLPRPSFWPLDLAPLFWPLVLALSVAALVALPFALGRLLSSRSPSEPPTASPAVSAPAATAAPPAASLPLAESLPVAAPEPAPAPSSTPMAAPSASVAEERRAASAAGGERAAASSTGLPTAAPEPPSGDGDGRQPWPPVDPALSLLARWMRPEADGLLLAVKEQPGSLRVSLQLDSRFRRLSPERQQRLASAWQDLATELGFEQLELRDPAGELLARSASVGSGMILYTPVPGA